MLTSGDFGKIGLGCMGLSGNYGQGLTGQAFNELIQNALSQGIRIFDTADCYDETSSEKNLSGATGHNERLLGKSLEASGVARDALFIASKCGFVPGEWSLDFSPAHIREACEQSLLNLNISSLDLYYLHRIPQDTKIFESSLDTLAKLRQEGKIKSIGLSEANAAMIRHADAYLRSIGCHKALQAVESEFSIFSPHVLHNGVLAACEELGLAFVPYSPLCRGLLTDAMSHDMHFGHGDFRASLPRFQGENFEANLGMKMQLAEIAREKGCTLAQLALAWIMHHGDFIFPIPGTKNATRLKENLGALQVTLTAADMQRIAQIVPHGAVGDRYTSEMRQAQYLPAVD